VLNLEEINTLVQLICERQTAMIISNHSSFTDKEYLELERLKVKVKGLENK
jgi:hypothetical protein